MGFTNKCVLRSKEGQFVTVRKFKEGLKLCTVEHQGSNNAPLVHIEEKGNWVAFIFERRKVFYCPKVVGGQLELQKIRIKDGLIIEGKLTADHWFERYNVQGGNLYGLRSVVEPKQYLYFQPPTVKKVFGISTSDSECALVTDEKLRE